ncbi:MAG: 3-hydroxyacyl-CoA dehydrogenase family protein [Chlamydiota bacterium]|nr:3-hydroxyacyl-CoA dehydrogenase family protein [Chlamydiota bacterium]
MNNELKNVAVLGASGKMGSGIALLLLQEMALEAATNHKGYSLKLIDTNEEGLYPLKKYLRSHITKFAEKNIISLREIYKDDTSLISNAEIIDNFVNHAMDITTCTTSIDEASTAKLIFEAIIEDEDIKAGVLNQLSTICSKDTFFFTNTSSIPIETLNNKAKLQNRLIGFHFYNPPAVQKLLEIIAPDDVNNELKTLANSLANKLKKIIVYSKDVAGFIGNGHFIPEAIYACKKATTLATEIPLHQAISILNYISKDYLVRPMGIFQLIDYVGIDVCQKIAKVMQNHLHDHTLNAPLIDIMVDKGIKGGQHPDGSQKDGFFTYKKTQLIGYYDFIKESYVLFEESNEIHSLIESLGEPPELLHSWKSLVKDPLCDEHLKTYFHQLSISNSKGAEIASDLIRNSISISQELVNRKIAQSIQDVSTVLKTGFFHLYGPDAPWVKYFTLNHQQETKSTKR